MKIGLACSRLGGRGGGMERQARDILECLVARGIDPVVITRSVDSDLPLVGNLRNLRIVRTGALPGKLRDKYFSWRAGRIRRREGLDVLISCHRVEESDIAHCGGNHIGYLTAMGKTPGWVDKMFIAMERRQFGNARWVVACSDLMRRELEAFYQVEPERIRVMHNTVDEARFHPIPAGDRLALRKELGLEEGRKYFLFPSGAHERKGLPFLRRFFERTDLPVELLVAGRGSVSGRNIRGVGYLHDIARYYQAVDATIMASVYEPFGLVGVESVACGTPVVLGSNMGCCEALREPALFAFAPGDQEGLERAVAGAAAFDRSGNGDLRRCIAYDFRIDSYVDELLRLARSRD